MSNKIVLRSVDSSNDRRQPLLRQSKSSGKTRTRLGEAVGGTAAVCCCAPCALANIVYLAIYKVPASLCTRALKKRKQRRHRRLIQSSGGEGKSPSRPRCRCGCYDNDDDDVGFRVYPTCGTDADDMAGDGINKTGSLVNEEEDKDVLELEKEMWDRFYSTGFWRSTSQRERS